MYQPFRSNFNRIALFALAGVCLGVAQKPTAACEAPVRCCIAPEEVTTEKRAIDLVICLDTSGSMDGLIDAARQKIWDIVNDLASAKPTPDLRVGLLTFGNDGHLHENGWVNVDSDLTTDLDHISERLFSFTTNGGTEYVGRVIQTATQELSWHPSGDAMKLILVAGNESADQDQAVRFRDACRDAIGKGVMINSIYCGGAEDSIAPAWREVAQLADGRFAAIDHNDTVVVATPFDGDLGKLSTELNSTYITYTALGKEAQQRQWAQDDNALACNSATVASRAATKAQGVYNNRSWDLVDACREEGIEYAAGVEIELLPADMQEMTEEERLEHIKEMTARRDALQKQILELSQKRDAFVQEEVQRQNLDASRSFDFVVRQAVREQAEARGFTFEKELEIEPAAVEVITKSVKEGC